MVALEKNSFLRGKSSKTTDHSKEMDALKYLFSLFKTELFYLHQINGTQGYCKEIVHNLMDRTFQFKCLDSYTLPFVIRALLGERVKPSDRVFYYNGLLCEFIEIPQISMDFNIKNQFKENRMDEIEEG